MLSYQHEYHAGNHADVLKHAVLALTIQALQRKEAPLRVFDAYAGSGVYDLGGPEAGKNREYEAGISRILAAASPLDELAPYLGAVGTGPLSIYPGSPQIARHLLRPQDHLELFEMHPRALVALREYFSGEPRVHIHDRDAFEGLPALLPPPERRGMVLVDPSYEVKHDFARVVDLLRHVYRRWPGGTYLAWYPLIAHPDARQFPARVAAAGIRRIFRAEMRVAVDDDQTGRGGLRGSGLLIVNLPFGLQARLEVLLPWLCKTLAIGPGSEWRAAWLVPE